MNFHFSNSTFQNYLFCEMVKSTQTIWQRIQRLWFPVTVEPVIFLYAVSLGLNEVIRSNLIIQKLCQSKLNYTEEICDDLGSQNNTQIAEEVRLNVTEYETLYGGLAFLPRILYGLMAGTWSDRNGRKKLIGLPLLGQLLATLTYLLNYFFISQLPWQTLYLELLNDSCGTYVAIYIGLYSYITDITEEDAMSFRLGILDGADYTSTAVGTLISGPIFLYGGYYAVFGSGMLSCVLGIIYLTFGVKESLNIGHGVNVETELQGSEVHRNYGSQTISPIQEENMKPLDRPVYITSILYIFESLKTVLKSRKYPRKTILFLGIFNFACYIFTYNGTEGTHRYAYARMKYGWSEQEFTRYLFNYRIGYMVALWVVSPILSRILNIPDPVISIMACCSSIIGFILPAVTQSSTWFTVGSFICMFSPLTTIMTRAVLSKTVPGDEIGRIFSVLSLFSAISGSLVESVFQSVFGATADTFPGAYLLLLAGLLGLTIPVNLMILLFFRRMEKSNLQQEETQISTGDAIFQNF
ncbi:proton-coupled folate transporter [Eurytemora carolleeae]|uniref:proton-coupled folate transporter n=1 Tax=Eurytemora carolleeae TaxID=1294199 RepID=UPI000C776052|nr:proton-coupled folate transporter [Eurytemora carolleeae]|eukprot:XP_023349851.1 proton-coupled folate transporter-like [Eurytemora affinis]